MSKPLTHTKERLLDVALTLIQCRGINDMSFQDLSDAVGIRKASVHYHFSSKAEMINALAERQLARFKRELQKILGNQVNAKTKLRRYCDVFVKTLKSDEQNRCCLFGMLMAEYSSLDEKGRQQIDAFIDQNVNVLEAILEEGVRDGSLRIKTPIRSKARLIFSCLEGGLLLSRCSGGLDAMKDTVNQIIQLLTK